MGALRSAGCRGGRCSSSCCCLSPHCRGSRPTPRLVTTTSGRTRTSMLPSLSRHRPTRAPPRRPWSSPPPRTMTVFAAAAVRPFIDDFDYDELVLEGTRREVCAGRLLTGSGWTFNEIVSRFGGTAGTMYSCRERWDAANDPDCNGQISQPGDRARTSRTTCWSNHAQGRAIDVMVGALSGGGYNRTRGLAIVNWLLARTPTATSTPTPAAWASSRSCSTTAAGTATATAASRRGRRCANAASATTTTCTST